MSASSFLERKHAAEEELRRVLREHVAPLIKELGASDCDIDLNWMRYVDGEADPVVNLRIRT